MKKIINSLFVLAITAMTFTSCEDVPMPYDMPTENGSTKPETETKADPTGSGTETEPYNVAAAVNLIKATEADKNTAPIYVKGKIVEIKNVETEKYGNASYYISDGKSYTQKLYIFQSLYLGNKKFTSADQIKVDDEVVVYGPFVNFRGNTPETAGKGATYLYSLNGRVEKPEDVPADDNSAEKPYSVTKAIELITTDKAPTVEVYVKGIISKAPSFYKKESTLTYYISDDGKTEKELQIYGGLSFNGGKFSGANDLQVGQTVVVYGVIKAYTNKEGKVINEMDKGNKLITVNGKTELIKEEENPSGGETVTLTNGDFEKWTDGKPDGWAASNGAGGAKLTQSTVAHGGSYSVEVEGDAKYNKRLATKEMKLKAGKYTIKFYAKAATADGGSIRPGYTTLGSDGKLVYNYGSYVNDLKNTEWTEVIHSFTLDAETEVNLVIMNSKKPGKNVLIDDFTLTAQ